ncbi:MAG: hypothetical protein MSC43_02380 [Clostridiales bacterium]|nr:hypothetical protein [Clostridiales bacterium]
MFDATAKFSLNPEIMGEFKAACRDALEQTGDQVLDDLRLSQTMPMEKGNLQNVLTNVDKSGLSDGTINIVSSGPYARRLYFHPEYNFRQDKNPLAGARWFDVYLAGHAKGEFIPDTFSFFLSRLLRG